MKKLISRVTRKLCDDTIMSLGYGISHTIYYRLYKTSSALNRIINPEDYKLSRDEQKALVKDLSEYIAKNDYIRVE